MFNKGSRSDVEERIVVARFQPGEKLFIEALPPRGLLYDPQKNNECKERHYDV